jgi:DNA anti-recombination protein RmuC
MKTFILFFALFLTPVSAFAQETILDKFGNFLERVRQINEDLKEEDRAFTSFVNSYRNELITQKRNINSILDAATKAKTPHEFIRLMNQAEFQLHQVYKNLELSCPNEWNKYRKVLKAGLEKFWKTK